MKKYYEGYEGKSKTRNKSSRLDQYYIEIKEKLAINGVTINGVYQYFKDKYGDIGTYSNFNKYVKLKNLKPKKTIRECEGNLSVVAARLGISRQTLYNKIKRYGL